MSKIEAYKPRITPIPYDNLNTAYPPMCYVNHEKTGGWHPETKAITVFKATAEEFSVEEFLWNMAAAVEAGCVDSDTFVLDFFGSLERVDAFAEALEEYDSQEFWVNERLFHAMKAGLNTYEAACITFSNMADKFREKAHDEVKALKTAKKPAAKKKVKQSDS